MQDLTTPVVRVEEDQNDSGFDLRRIWRVIWTRKWIIVGITLLTAVLSLMFVLRQTPIYRATATLQIEREPTQPSPFQDPYSVYADQYLYYQTQYGLIKRRAIAERVAEELDMLPDPTEPVLEPAEPAKPGLFTLERWLPEGWLPETPEVPVRSARDNVLAGIVGAIQLSPRRDSQLVDISIENANPVLAAQIANAVARAYIEDNLAGRIEMNQAGSSFLSERLAELKENLTESEEALQTFKDSERLVATSDVDSVANQELSAATEKVTSARRGLSDLEVRLEQLRAAQSDPQADLASLPGIVDSAQVAPVYRNLVDAQAEVDRLSNRYGPKHPRMIAAQGTLEAARKSLREQVIVATEVLRQDVANARAVLRAAESELEAVKGRVRSFERQTYDLARLEREVQANRDIYQRFLGQYKETDAVGEVQAANARLVELALPPTYPVKPNKKRSLMMGMLLGLMLSIGLCFLLEHLDNTLKSSEDVERHTGLPVLGVLPRLKTSESDNLQPLRHFKERKRSIFSESIRTVRTGVLLSGLDDAHKVVVVTSSVPGEGKTTLSMNLARALSEMRKVLLIDADMRRPMIASALGQAKDHPGLSQFISGERKLSECVSQIPESSLFVMSAGVIPPNPLEMLSSNRFSEALDSLAEKFDHIVIDAAPVLAVSDALVLSRLASSVIYVIRADATPTPAVKDGVKRLRRVDAHLIGAVINRAQGRGKAGYGKYSGYGYGYYTDYGYAKPDK